MPCLTTVLEGVREDLGDVGCFCKMAEVRRDAAGGLSDTGDRGAFVCDVCFEDIVGAGDSGKGSKAGLIERRLNVLDSAVFAS